MPIYLSNYVVIQKVHFTYILLLHNLTTFSFTLKITRWHLSKTYAIKSVSYLINWCTEDDGFLRYMLKFIYLLLYHIQSDEICRILNLWCCSWNVNEKSVSRVWDNHTSLGKLIPGIFNCSKIILCEINALKSS